DGYVSGLSQESPDIQVQPIPRMANLPLSPAGVLPLHSCHERSLVSSRLQCTRRSRSAQNPDYCVPTINLRASEAQWDSSGAPRLDSESDCCIQTSACPPEKCDPWAWLS